MNDGLQARHPNAFLMAGSMFEQGLCVKPEWDRAQGYYRSAVAVGHRAGHYRIVAGFAERDPAVALWWTQQGSAPVVPAECQVPPEVHGDAEAYAAALHAWPPGRLTACAHVAGVMAAVHGEVEYPGDVVGRGMNGQFQMVFHPAEGRIDWTVPDFTITYRQFVEPPAVVSARWAKQFHADVREYLESVGKRALARFPTPAGIDPSWQFSSVLRMSVE
ncbi:hypothetical protein [Rubrivivax albus]|uniref:Uncharacterized protein n=1 Tax=Rubrivivax albus TaxID=2499835 RepID=A0A3S2TNE0_9BURK|nr:hypothetical protein [Rubrivivax albus]RVT48902.1 hypothetical protein ENE75_21340 [Rubrivivax albus]